MRETWYVLEDGAYADPNEVAPDEEGALRHKSGVAVAMRGDAHSSISVDPDEERAKAAAKKDTKALTPEKEMKPDAPKRGYQTRDVKGG
jgi:hypothetical protein